MSEAEPIPPTSSVTALRIPMIKKGEYDLWSMKMRYEIKGSTLKKVQLTSENIVKRIYSGLASSKSKWGRKEKKIVAIEDSNSKALVATNNNEEIDWTKEFDAETVTFAMMALTELDQDDWSMEIECIQKDIKEGKKENA
ncbi:hypothetical protein Tco_1255666 [Tanacetum coccineum]